MESEIIDSPENYRGDMKKFGMDMNQIQLEHINRTLKLMSQELRGGYYDENVIQVSGQMIIKKTYIEDGRAAVCNSVETLFSIIQYAVLKDKPDSNLLDEAQKTMECIQKLYEEYMKEVTEVEEAEEQKVVRYRYISNKLILYKNMFNQLLKVKAELDGGPDGKLED